MIFSASLSDGALMLPMILAHPILRGSAETGPHNFGIVICLLLAENMDFSSRGPGGFFVRTIEFS